MTIDASRIDVTGMTQDEIEALMNNPVLSNAEKDSILQRWTASGGGQQIVVTGKKPGFPWWILAVAGAAYYYSQK